MARTVRIVFAAALLYFAAGCGDESGSSLPNDSKELTELVNPVLATVGLEFTYGSVSDVEGRHHLALYAQPTGPSSDQEFLDRIVTSTAAIAPFVFDRFPEIDSFDLCQEPVPTGPGDPDYPEPRTAVFLTRDQADEVTDWSALTLPELIELTRRGEGGEIRADDAIAALPDYAAAGAEASVGPTDDR